jgi:hypothetical protein
MVHNEATTDGTGQSTSGYGMIGRTQKVWRGQDYHTEVVVVMMTTRSRPRNYCQGDHCATYATVARFHHLINSPSEAQALSL